MLERIRIPGARLGRCVVVPNVGYLVGETKAVAQGLTQIELLLGKIEVVAEFHLDGEHSIQFRW